MIVSRSGSSLRIWVRNSQAQWIASRLEVVSEAEVAQHLEEGFMERRLADVVDIAGPQAFLAGGRAGEVRVAQAHELPLELIHPRRREQDGRVVGNEHVAWPANASLGSEEVEIGVAEFVCGHVVCGQGLVARRSSSERSAAVDDGDEDDAVRSRSEKKS